MASADYTSHGAIAVITLDHAPVNALCLELRSGIAAGLERAWAAPEVRAIVITGAGAGTFCGGADVSEFGSPQMTAAPDLRELCTLLERSPKPVIAALNGTALGGGLELAMACHYRIALASASLGLPEVKLGLLPGAGGTQRLPRLIAPDRALSMIVSGNPVAARDLAPSALLDLVVEEGVLGAALEFAARFAPAQDAIAKDTLHARDTLKKARDRTVSLQNAEAFFDFARGAIAPLARHYPAPSKCIDAVEAAVLKPFEEGMALERALFGQLLISDESRALRHVFFATRAASKVPGISAETPVRNIRSVGIVGAGTMGGGIAMAFANAGLEVTVLDATQAALDKGLGVVRRNYESTLKKGRLSQAEFERRIGAIRGSVSYEDIAAADLAIEAVFEDLEVKRTVFERLDAVMKPRAILASNTSTLDLNRIAGFTRRPEDVVGLHFFSPANVTRLLEIVRGARTAPDVLATSLALAKQIKKIGVVSGVCDGFIGNRMLNAFFREMQLLLDVGALPQQIDRALEAFGFAMGPFRVSDLAGNDIGWAIRKRHYAEHPEQVFSRVPDRLCELGRFGQKTQAGWYDYKPGDRTAIPSDVVTNMILEESARLGLTRRAVSDEEIVERALYSLINEGARVLEEGIALRASDIDVVYIAGYGFPDFRGGPMFYADTVGLPNVLRSMRRFAQGYRGDTWAPAPLLTKLAAENRGFARWERPS
ncbi:MAG TPA: 3-hydroxyacyl-CoA dehydrogenase NAD-binding domain-containing protein [Steroidobacteraceae bacterium]|nr:3-hydroxyacyl-CoA dehydrogenase NAD-binding domain-containing protein [Steroidobacteraceae bacterium]